MSSKVVKGNVAPDTSKAEQASIDATVAALMATLSDGIEVMDTIVPPDAGPSPRLPAVRLELGKTLGEGGMGVVRVARQSALGREVAVKTLRDEHKGEAFERRLLQEAWTTGTLEHPNVVPVYDIDVDDDDKPLIVLKRIEGRTWDELMHDPVALSREQGASDELEWNIRVLMQVCRALQFAHRRGFVHRDLKPENVMVGSFGEVYVLDWGIAVATQDDGTGRFPLASEARAMAGTPAYMAPEMLGGKEPNIGPWTDIYLVGAVLYEILAGKAPHQGDALPDVIRSVLTGPPTIDGDAELLRICRRAMDTDRLARFENVEQFRLALEGFLRHRGARRLAERAEESRRAMDVHLQSGDDSAADAAFAECRFGFRAALESWPGFEAAQKALWDAEETMARADIEAGRPEAAERLLATHPSVPPDLQETLRKALTEQAAERESVARFRDDVSRDVGHTTRSFIIAVVCLGWILGPMIRGYFYQAGGVLGPVLPSLIFVVVVVGLLVWARDSMTKTRLNRSLGGLLASIALANFLVSGISAAAGFDHVWIDRVLPLVWLTGTLFAVFAIHVHAWPSVVVMTVAAYVCLRYPEWRDEASSLANTLLFINVVFIDRSVAALTRTLDGRRERGSGKPPLSE